MQPVGGDNFKDNNDNSLQGTNIGGAIDEAMSRTSEQADVIYKVIRRNGKVTPFDRSKIEVALTKAFLGVEGGVAAASSRIHDEVRKMALQVNGNLFRRMPDGGIVHIEDIQDQVELALMRSGERKVARAYVIYREERAQARAEKAESEKPEKAAKKDILNVTTADGETKPLDKNRLRSAFSHLLEMWGRWLIDRSAMLALTDRKDLVNP